MDHDNDRSIVESIRVVIRTVGSAQWGAWIGWRVHHDLGVDRFKWPAHWSAITNALVQAMLVWSETGSQKASLGLLRKGVQLYDAWVVQTGQDKALVLTYLELLICSFLKARLRSDRPVEPGSDGEGPEKPVQDA